MFPPPPPLPPSSHLAKHFQNISKLFPKYFQNISKLFPNYFQNISKMFPKYFQNISKIFPKYFLKMQNASTTTFSSSSFFTSCKIFPQYFLLSHSLNCLDPLIHCCMRLFEFYYGQHGLCIFIEYYSLFYFEYRHEPFTRIKIIT